MPLKSAYETQRQASNGVVGQVSVSQFGVRYTKALSFAAVLQRRLFLFPIGLQYLRDMKKILFFSICLLACSISCFAQKRGDKIRGVILDNNDFPLVNVKVKELTKRDHAVARTKTDINGEFSFRLRSNKHRLDVECDGYETVDVPLVKNYFNIKMRPLSELPVVFGCEFKTILDKDSKAMKYLQNYAPDNFICGYAIGNPYGSINYGVFLVKEGIRYSLVYKKGDAMKTTCISSIMAHHMRLSLSMKRPITTFGYPEIPWFDDCFTVFAVKPGKAIYFDSLSNKLPDKLWQAELEKLQKEQ